MIAGFDDRWPQERRLSLLPGVLHGPVLVGRAEDDLAEGDDRRYAQASSGFSHQFPGYSTADSHR